jgi:hypothetical protein
MKLPSISRALVIGRRVLPEWLTLTPILSEELSSLVLYTGNKFRHSDDLVVLSISCVLLYSSHKAHCNEADKHPTYSDNPNM